MIGTKIYKKDMSKYTECAVWANENNAQIVDKGEYYEVVAIPAPSLDEAKQTKLLKVDQWTASKITGGFTSSCTGSLVKYDSDKDTQITMQGIGLNADSIPKYYPKGIPVRGYEQGNDYKTVLMLTPAQLMHWLADLSLHIGQCKQQGWQKQAEVNACKTIEELNAIEVM